MNAAPPERRRLYIAGLPWPGYRIADSSRNSGSRAPARSAATGFAVETFRLVPVEQVRYGLLRDERLDVARKPA